MKLEVGMYVRTKWGISQYKEYETTNDNKILCIPVKDGSNGIFANIEDIEKASNNIIDLIEVGDYVNGTIVTTKTPNKYIELDYSYNRKGCCEEDIKTVVTKEQFESMQYKVD
jgi:hypothetical protein